MGFPGGSDSKEFACSAGDPGFILGQENPLEKGTATHSSIFAWRIPWTEKPGRIQPMGLQRVGHEWATNTFTFILNGRNLCFYVFSSFSTMNITISFVASYLK